MTKRRERFPIQVRTRWLDYSPSLHSHARTRLEAALRSFASRIHSVNVRISAHGGPEERRCEVDVAMTPAGLVAASAAGPDAYRAVEAAARRTRALVRRHVARARQDLRGVA